MLGRRLRTPGRFMMAITFFYKRCHTHTQLYWMSRLPKVLLRPVVMKSRTLLQLIP